MKTDRSETYPRTRAVASVLGSGIVRLIIFASIVFLFYDVFRQRLISAFALPYRYLEYLVRLVGFDFGMTDTGTRVSVYLRAAGVNTLLLIAPSLAISLSLSVIIARNLYGRHGTPAIAVGNVLRTVSRVLNTVPVYWLAGVFYIIAIKTRWFPIGDIRSPLAHTFTPFGQILDRIWHSVLPVSTLVASQLVLISDPLISRIRKLEHSVSHRALRSRGIPRKRILSHHVRPVLLRELMATTARLLPFFFTYLVFVEIVFGHRGLGYFAASLFRRFSTGGFPLAHAALLYLGLSVIALQTIFRLSSVLSARGVDGGASDRLKPKKTTGVRRFAVLVAIPALSYLIGLVPDSRIPAAGGALPVLGVLAVSGFLAMRHRKRHDGLRTIEAVGGDVHSEKRRRRPFSRLRVSRRSVDRNPGLTGRPLEATYPRRIGLFVMLALLAGCMVTPWFADIAKSLRFLKPPSWEHPFGTLLSGIDLLSLVAVAGRFLVVPAAAACVAGLIGGVAGVYRGMYPSDTVSRGLDFLARQTEMFPSIVILMLVSGAFRGAFQAYAIALIVIGALRFYRTMSHASTRIFERGYTQYSRYTGAGIFVILRNHLLPELRYAFGAGVMILAADLVVLDANASFLGTLINASESVSRLFPVLGWGSLLVDARSELLRGNWWLSLFPVLVLSAVIALLRGIADRFSKMDGAG